MTADEAHPLALALDDQAHGDGLHAPGREPRRDLLPEHRRHLVAEEPVEDAPRLLRLDELLVDGARVRERLLDRGRVISWKTMRWTGTRGLSTSSRCQAIASPSRSSSVAR
jgi:hypothetical protein